MIIEKALQPREVDCTCGTCGRGRMRPTGAFLASSPPQYPHRCDRCGAEAVYPCRFPYLRWVDMATALQ